MKNSDTDFSKNNIRKILGRGLIISGVGLFLAVAVYNIANYSRGRGLVEDFDEYRAAVLETDEDGTVNVNVNISEEAYHNYLQWQSVIGVMEIPTIKCREPIKEEVISYCLGHMAGTAGIGEQGNCCIAGHRNYNGGRYFHNIDKLVAGDEIIIKTLGGEYIYKVTESFVVKPEQVEVLDNYDDGATLTLITCTPLYIGTHRLIVRAELAESNVYEVKQ